MANLHENIRSSDSRASHPELYSAPAQPSAEDEVSSLLATLVYLLKPDFVLETGTAFGHTAERIATALQANGVGHLDTCELAHSRAVEARERLAGLPATVHQGPYTDFTPAHRSYALAFFDATRHARDEEFHHFRRWLPQGAICVFHDCGEQHPGRAGVDRLEAAGLIKSLFIPTPRGVCLAQVQ